MIHSIPSYQNNEDVNKYALYSILLRTNKVNKLWFILVLIFGLFGKYSYVWLALGLGYEFV